MARLRPARTCRTPNSQAWARFSLKKPRKNYVRAMPRRSIIVFNMGKDSNAFDTTMTLNTTERIQLRSNALESARQITNRYLENNIPGEYYFRVLVFPHNVIREHKMATGAGADRISQGMSMAFGSPVSVAARVNANQPIFMVKTDKKNIVFVKEAYRRAGTKLSSLYKIKISEKSIVN